MKKSIKKVITINKMTHSQDINIQQIQKYMGTIPFTVFKTKGKDEGTKSQLKNRKKSYRLSTEGIDLCSDEDSSDDFDEECDECKGKE